MEGAILQTRVGRPYLDLCTAGPPPGWLWDIDPLVNCHVHSLDVLSFLLGVGADVNVRSDDDDWCV